MPAAARRFVVNEKEIAAQILGGEAILINLSSGVYYSMDGASGAAWALIAAGQNAAATIKALTERYAVDAAAVEADLDALLETLTTENIIAPADDGAAAVEVDQIADLPAPGEGLAYKKLELNIYRDMGDLLALDPPMPGIDDIPWKVPSE